MSTTPHIAVTFCKAQAGHGLSLLNTTLRLNKVQFKHSTVPKWIQRMVQTQSKEFSCLSSGVW